MSSLNPIGTPFIELPTVDSTNNYAMGLVRAAMAQHGTAVFAYEQTQGKGQRNKQWNSQKDQNIALSLVLEPEYLNCPGLFFLSMTVAVGTHNFLSSFSPEFMIKWPNDIYWRDRKAAGILIENLWQGDEWKSAIAGIGVNINQVDFGALSSKAISLRQITGRTFQPQVLARELCQAIAKQLELLSNDASVIGQEYKKKLYKLNERVKLKKANRIFEARIKDVSASGELIVEHGMEERFNVGEVEWII